MISSKLDLKDLKQAAYLARYRFSFLVRLFTEHHSWIIGASAVVLTWTNLSGRTHESWRWIAFLYGLVLLALLAQTLWIETRFRRKLAKLNASEVDMEIASSGLIFRLRDGSSPTLPWQRFLDARLGSRVLLLFYVPQKARIRRRKYLIVPLHGLNPSQRNEILLALPLRLRSPSIQQALKQWRLA
jgi:hypothetical protein